jgi:uncharacterized protein
MRWPDRGSRVSRENVEIVRRSLRAFEHEGFEGALSYFHPRIEWTTTDAFLDAATYRGHQGVLRYYGAIASEFDDLRIEPRELIEAGEQVVVSVRISGRGKASGAPVELSLTEVCSLRDGKIVRIRNYEDRAAALRAAGLAE